MKFRIIESQDSMSDQGVGLINNEQKPLTSVKEIIITMQNNCHKIIEYFATTRNNADLAYLNRDKGDLCSQGYWTESQS